MRAIDAVILAGGLGTRLKSEVPDLPKPLAPIGPKPFLTYLLQWLKQQKIEKIVLATGYGHAHIAQTYGDSYDGIPLVYSNEKTPLGTGGAIRQASGFVNGSDFVVVNGDTYFDLDLQEFIRFHQNRGFELSIALKNMDRADRYGTVTTTGDQITGFLEKKNGSSGTINGGVYIIQKEVLDPFPGREPFSFERDLLEHSLDKLKIGGKVFDGFFIDIGIPEDYRKAQDLLPRLNLAKGE